MTVFLSGQRMTADLLNDNSIEETSTSGLVASSNFTAVSFSGRRVNGFVTVTVTLTRTTSAIAGAASGNIADTAMCTLPSGWRPPEEINGMWASGFNDGECTCTTAGVITLRSSSGTDGVQVDHSPVVNLRWIE